LILALRWIQKEGPRFGGNVKKIAAMGNSGGASALQMLMASPAVEPNTFDKVIISSGMIRFGPHQSLIVTQMVTERLNVNPNLQTRISAF
jgi:carboxylesterase type B